MEQVYYLVNNESKRIEKIIVEPGSIVRVPFGSSAIQLDELFALRDVIVNNPTPPFPEGATDEVKAEMQAQALAFLEETFAAMVGFDFIDTTTAG